MLNNILVIKKTTSQKKKAHLQGDGYRFRKAGVLKNGDISWRCITRACCGRLRVTAIYDVIFPSTNMNQTLLESNPKKLN